jgi:hypothetical protein
MTTWYVIDIRYNQIVKTIVSADRPSLDKFKRPEQVRITANPPLDLLERYEYWSRS